MFDALTSERPYKKPFSLEKTLEIMENERGSHFDPDVLDPFLKIAEGLHAQMADLEMQALRRKVLAVITPYFN